jgi:hypothetical protein
VVGWQAHDPQGHEVPNSTINDLVASVRAGGRIGLVGVFVPEDPPATSTSTPATRAGPR